MLILIEFFEIFDQNSNQKTELLPLAKVDRFQWRICLQNSSKNHKFRWLFFKNFDQNWLEMKLQLTAEFLWKLSYIICQFLSEFWKFYEKFEEFWSEYWWKFWKIYFHQNTCEKFEGFRSEFFKNWIFDQNSGNLKNLDQNTGENFEGFRSKVWKFLIRILLKDLKDFDQNSGGCMTMEFFKNWISIRILVKNLKYLIRIQMTTEFFKNCNKMCKLTSKLWYEIPCMYL